MLALFLLLALFIIVAFARFLSLVLFALVQLPGASVRFFPGPDGFRIPSGVHSCFEGKRAAEVLDFQHVSTRTKKVPDSLL